MTKSFERMSAPSQAAPVVNAAAAVYASTWSAAFAVVLVAIVVAMSRTRHRNGRPNPFGVRRTRLCDSARGPKRKRPAMAIDAAPMSDAIGAAGDGEWAHRASEHTTTTPNIMAQIAGGTRKNDGCLSNSN